MTQLGCLTKKDTIGLCHTLSRTLHSEFECIVPSKNITEAKKKKQKKIESVLVSIQLLLLRTRNVGVSPSQFFSEFCICCLIRKCFLYSATILETSSIATTTTNTIYLYQPASTNRKRHQTVYFRNTIEALGR